MSCKSIGDVQADARQPSIADTRGDHGLATCGSPLVGRSLPLCRQRRPCALPEARGVRHDRLVSIVDLTRKRQW
jgi:hypothetical protein